MRPNDDAFLPQIATTAIKLQKKPSQITLRDAA
jgi:hypothetical protein